MIYLLYQKGINTYSLRLYVEPRPRCPTSRGGLECFHLREYDTLISHSCFAIGFTIKYSTVHSQHIDTLINVWNWNVIPQSYIIQNQFTSLVV